MELLRWLWAMLRQRCPHCYRGPVFRGWMTTYQRCPVCGTVFQPEEGYFLGAMYASYVLSSVILGAAFFTGRWLLPDWHPLLVVVLVGVLYLPLVPAVARYARVVWMYFDRWACPPDSAAGSYEKWRQGRGA
jgi:uncharacterized protein (DUF983 family)